MGEGLLLSMNRREDKVKNLMGLAGVGGRDGRRAAVEYEQA